MIIGGGIAGLWTLNRLRGQGYQAVLLEKNALGFGQTIASQGIIHGGIKYALQGALTRSSQEISDMPAIWRDCLNNQGEIDLSGVSVLSDNYYLCSQQKITQTITQFFAQKALHSDNQALAREQYPDFFQAKTFSGLLTKVHECVLDVPSLIRELAKTMMPYIFKISDVTLQKTHATYQVIIKNQQQETLQLAAKHIILTAGEGNETLLPICKMQKRPLQMVILKADHLPRIYVHCVALSTNPVLTITSHSDDEGKTIWYIGGQIAEDGASRDHASQIAAAAALLKQQFPWFMPENPHWQTLYINRAEGFNHGKRPESITLNTCDNIIIAWPTKLTFAPLLANKIVQMLPQLDKSAPLPEALLSWSKPELASTYW